MNLIRCVLSFPQVGNARKIHRKSWEKLTLSKKDGGKGFRDLRVFNLAMLAKQGWRLLHDTNSLVYKCLKARYFPRFHFLESKVSPNCSYVWKSIMVVLPTLKSGCCWKVGSGHSIRVLGINGFLIIILHILLFTWPRGM